MREVDGGARDREVPAPERPRHRRLDLGRREQRARTRPAWPPSLPRADRVDGLPEPGVRAEPVAEGRRAGRGSVHRPRRPGEGGRQPGARGSEDSADRRSVERTEPLSTPALGRNAAAGRDRDGPGKESGAADPRRADDRARRDRRGGGTRSRGAAAGGAGHGGAVHQSQPRRDLEDVRPRWRALRRTPRRGGARRDGAPGSAPPVHGRPPPLHPPRRSSQGSRPAGHDPRLPPTARNRASRLRLRRSLRARRRALPCRGAAVLRRRERTPEQVLVPRPGTGASARDGRRPRAASRRPLAAAARRARGAYEGLQATRQRGSRAHGRQRGDLARRDARARRRVRQREDDARADAARHRPSDVGERDPRRDAAARALPEALAEGTCVPFRSCSRTRTRPSTAATPSVASCSARCENSRV